MTQENIRALNLTGRVTTLGMAKANVMDISPRDAAHIRYIGTFSTPPLLSEVKAYASTLVEVARSPEYAGKWDVVLITPFSYAASTLEAALFDAGISWRYPISNTDRTSTLLVGGWEDAYDGVAP